MKPQFSYNDKHVCIGDQIIIENQKRLFIAYDSVNEKAFFRFVTEEISCLESLDPKILTNAVILKGTSNSIREAAIYLTNNYRYLDTEDHNQDLYVRVQALEDIIKSFYYY